MSSSRIFSCFCYECCVLNHVLMHFLLHAAHYLHILLGRINIVSRNIKKTRHLVGGAD